MMAKTAITHTSRYGSHSVLSQPSIKFFIGQLKRVHQVATDCASPSLQIRLRSSQQIINVRCVWLQGDLLQWQDDGDTLLLDDGTGVAKIGQVKKIFNNQKIAVGSYVMAIGEVLHINNKLVTIRALKIVNLTTDPDSMTIWLYETIDLHQTIYKPY